MTNISKLASIRETISNPMVILATSLINTLGASKRATILITNADEKMEVYSQN